MRIGVDARIMNRHLGGMAVYVKSLLEELRNIDQKNSYILLDDRYLTGWGFWQKLNWVVGEQIWLQHKLIKVFKDKKLDIGVFPNPPVPLLLNVPIILTIPDLAFFYDKGAAGWVKAYLWIMYFLSAYKASNIVTFSRNSKQDIIRVLKTHPDKISVIALAAAKTIRRIKDKQEIIKVKARYGIIKPFVMAVPGTFLHRKNTVELIQVFSDVLPKAQEDFQLVIVGRPSGSGFENAVLQARQLGVEKEVVFTGRIDDYELSCLYSGALVFVCTSLYEGFGLPVLEAMKCGTPVISYNNSSLPEVVGNAGILVNNSSELAEAVLTLFQDKVKRAELRGLGLKRAILYDWEKTANNFFTLLEGVEDRKIVAR